MIFANYLAPVPAWLRQSCGSPSVSGDCSERSMGAFDLLKDVVDRIAAGDPWSEHIAFPGGSRSADEDALQTLRREVQEEVGWHIEEHEWPTPLPQLRIRLAGRERLMLLDAFVHRIEGATPALRCGPEVASAFWIPFAELWDAKNLDHHALGDNGETLVYPAIRNSQGIILGITIRVLKL